MRTQNNTALKSNITNNDIEHVLSLRRTYEAQKKRLEMAENALKQVESEIMTKIDSGASVISSYEVQVKTTERRNVAWKSVCAEALGASEVDEIIKNTKPDISYRLLIKAA